MRATEDYFEAKKAEIERMEDTPEGVPPISDTASMPSIAPIPPMPVSASAPVATPVPPTPLATAPPDGLPKRGVYRYGGWHPLEVYRAIYRGIQ